MDALWIIVIVLVVLWVLGFGGGMVIGGGLGPLIHILLVVAIIVIIVRLIRGERL